MGMYAAWISDALPTISVIQKAVANRFNMPLEELLGEDRYRPLVLRRHLAIYLCAEAIGNRHADIGKAFNRDRSMIPHAINRIDEIIKIDPEFAKIVNELKREVGLIKRGKSNAQRRSS